MHAYDLSLMLWKDPGLCLLRAKVPCLLTPWKDVLCILRAKLTCNRTCLEGWGSACLEYLSVLAAEFAWNLSGSLHAWSKDCKCCQQMNLLETELKLEKQSLLPVLMQFQSFCYINFVMRQ